MERPLTIHLIDAFTACNWQEADGKTCGHSAMLHAHALGYKGRWDVRIRWLWAIAEALRQYEGTTGRAYPADGIMLEPVKMEELRGFLASLPGAWPDDSSRRLADRIHELSAGGMVVRVRVANRRDLQALMDRGDSGIRRGMIERAAMGLGVTGAVLAGV